MVDECSQLKESRSYVHRGSGLYVDVENLLDDGQTAIEDLIGNWPSEAPTPSRLNLYVRANQEELWHLWAASRFCNLEVAVRGTQHFSMSPTKNSADISIATNAMADLLLKRVNHVVVFSDDSDFISLYAAIRDEPAIPSDEGKVPFLWVVTDREGKLSTSVRKFFPPEGLHVVAVKQGGTQQPDTSESSRAIWADMARAVLADIPVGPFKSTDCQPVIVKRWPKHPVARAGRPAFGIEFKNNIWPVLQGFGVKIKNPEKKPIQYEMTAEAKKSVG